MITFDQLSKIFEEQLKILFPDKHTSSNKAVSKDLDSYEMQFHIVVDPKKPHYIIGFTKKVDSSIIEIWNGKRVNKIIDIDTDDNFIRRYHEPQLYAESSNCLEYTQVAAIYTALDTFLNCDEEDEEERYVAYDPAFPEKESIEENVDINTMEDIKSSALEIVPQFNIASDVLRLGLPYIIRNIKTGTTIIAALRVVDVKKLEFVSWNGNIEIDAKEYHKDDWKIYPANTIKG